MIKSEKMTKAKCFEKRVRLLCVITVDVRCVTTLRLPNDGLQSAIHLNHVSR